MTATREQRLADTFVELADTLVANFDVVEFTHVLANRCVELLDVAAVGLMLADQHSRLRLMASSSEQSRLLELFELEADEGPCLECFHSKRQAADTDLRTRDERWPDFADRAVELGYLSVHAIPLRLRDETIGVLNLFNRQSGALDEKSMRTGQALADVATIGLLHERAVRHHQVLAEQLQSALNSRVMIEQAKGLLSERFRTDMQTAFLIMREYSRVNNRKLSVVAGDIVTRKLTADKVIEATRSIDDRDLNR